MSGMIDSDDDRSRSPLPLRSPRTPDDEESSSDETLTPQSKKMVKIVRKIVAKELAPIKRNLTKNLDTTTQVKSTVEQVKRGLTEVKMSQSNISEHLQKAQKADPKAQLSSYVVGKVNGTVFSHMKSGKKKEELITAVFDELLDKGIISPADEDSIKAVAATEFSHLKSHLRNLLSQDLAIGNSADFPKAIRYLKVHLKDQNLSGDTQEFLITMALALVKFENLKPVQLTESDKTNKKKINEHVDFFWSYVKMKFDKFQERGETQGGKLKTLLLSCGYQAKKGEGSVRRAVQP